ncbi:hypothetical protein IB235_17735 [Paracoccus sp. PAR01]|nr:hypothetical protein [Paracoccus sp. PAR01]
MSDLETNAAAITRGNPVVIENQTFRNETIEIDGIAFSMCTFENCTLVFRGGKPPGIMGCRFNDCFWSFGGPAANTMSFLTGLARGGMQSVVENTFANIMTGKGGERIGPRDIH